MAWSLGFEAGMELEDYRVQHFHFADEETSMEGLHGHRQVMTQFKVAGFSQDPSHITAAGILAPALKSGDLNLLTIK